jgi:TetR/AcrR family transcriptional regulator, transcriptional repressor for nem operon
MTPTPPPAASSEPTRRRGRPPLHAQVDTRAALLRAGLEVLTEQGFSASGLDGLLRRVQVPKGSFYHYFASKDAYGRALIDAYDAYFRAKLVRHFDDATQPPLQRLAGFVADAADGMARHGFARGCLVGNLGAEVGALPDDYRLRLEAALQGWQALLAGCLAQACAAGELPADADCGALAAFFWTGWEGAVLRARLTRSAAPLQLFLQGFLASLPTFPATRTR